jgi:hypothetical protein
MVSSYSLSVAPVPTPVGFPTYPEYAGRYKILDLMKLQFSKIAKNARREFSGLMARPKVEFHTEYRFSTNMTNREFRRNWFNNHKGRFIASEHKRHLVFTSRPGPGPLVKAAKYLRQQADKSAKAKLRREKSNMRSKGTEGPLRPARADGVLRDSVQLTSKPSTYVVPQRRKGHVNDPDPKGRYKAQEKRLMFTHQDSISHTAYTRALCGVVRSDGVDYYTKPPPESHWGKYWYFYRKYGRWRVSVHHPYGDEEEAIKKWTQRGLLS